jgi:hypothetical protein
MTKKNVPRHPFRLAVYCWFPQSDDPRQWVYSYHRVNMGAVSSMTQLAVPRYLFRVYSEKSAGLNTPGLFRSERARRGLACSMEAMGESEIHDSLVGHMSTRIKNFASPWISLSTSVPWIMAKALRLKDDGHSAKSLKIAIIDTLNLPRGAQLFHAGALLRAYNVEEHMGYQNLAGSMVLAWGEIKAPMAVISVQDFLPDASAKGHLQPGYLALQPFHLETVDVVYRKRYSMFRNPPKSTRLKGSKSKRRVRGKTPNTGLVKPHAIRKRIFRRPSHWKAFVLVVQKGQAPRTYRREQVAGRTFWGKKFHKQPQDHRAPMSPYQMNAFVSLVKRNVGDPRFQLPMLLFLLSTRKKDFYVDSMVDRILELSRECHPLRVHHISSTVSFLLLMILSLSLRLIRRRPDDPRIQQVCDHEAFSRR